MENQKDVTDDAEEEIENLEALELEPLHAQNEEIAKLKSQIDELQDKLLRTVAESENTRRRFEKMIEETRDYAVSNFAKDLLSIMDNLTRSLQYQDLVNVIQITSVITGVEMTKNELESTFKKHGLEIINPMIGSKFDYNVHHAVSQIETSAYDPDNIMEIMQVGYKLKDRLLRPAIVKVSKKAPE